MQSLSLKLLTAWTVIYTRVGGALEGVFAFVSNHKLKIIFVLALMDAFGIIAPETATALRDAFLALAL